MRKEVKIVPVAGSAVRRDRYVTSIVHWQILCGGIFIINYILWKLGKCAGDSSGMRGEGTVVS